MTLEHRVVLITGPRRIGAEVARRAAARGADVALSYHQSQREAEAVAAAIRAAGRRAECIQADLADGHACRALIGETVARLGRLDVLVNMASLYVPTPFDALDEAAWDRGLAVDVKAAFLCSQAAVPHMRRAGGGRIINVADWLPASGRVRYKGFLPYYVAKSGVIALTEALALELASDDILVNAVAPGPILAPPGTEEEEVRAVEQATPLGRWGGEAEVAKAVLFLIDTDFVTGEVVRVDGGRHLR
ncbi:MAG TPA: SDR family oxidoreductase [Vicinamibacterales bacterium]|nr:SDR family oxidoreductase [Vicinamibacterales bacterium]HOQ59847.1 SDR family oxidoreductase [Vicinamibacterales bacterium]HPK70874.1 SDR family oxidoreductase [Vicinamibacterales bacterium]